MTNSVSLPIERTHPLQIPPLLRELRTRGSIHRVRTAVGDPAWLVTGYADVKRLLASDKLGRTHREPEKASRIGESALVSGPVGNFDTEPADSARTRALLQPHFSPHRMRMLRGRVDTLLTGLMDDLVERDRPLDLVEALAIPLPTLVVCDLLGVPYEEREQFGGWVRAAADVTDQAQSFQAMRALFGYCQELVTRKRRDPADDITSRLCENESVGDTEIATLIGALLFAGFETTSIHIGLGLLLFLVNRDQWQAIVADPALIPNAIDEVIRATPGPVGGDIPRYARDDIEVGSVTIKAGDLVLLDNSAANFDPAAFTEPEAFDVTRQAGGHLSFGYGPRYCIGAPLAKVELEAVFRHMVHRLPQVRLAVDVRELSVRANTQTGGLVRLPVKW